MVLSEDARRAVVEKRAFEAKVARDRADERRTKGLWGEVEVGDSITGDDKTYGSM